MTKAITPQQSQFPQRAQALICFITAVALLALSVYAHLGTSALPTEVGYGGYALSAILTIASLVLLTVKKTPEKKKPPVPLPSAPPKPSVNSESSESAHTEPDVNRFTLDFEALLKNVPEHAIRRALPNKFDLAVQDAIAADFDRMETWPEIIAEQVKLYNEFIADKRLEPLNAEKYPLYRLCVAWRLVRKCTLPTQAIEAMKQLREMPPLSIPDSLKTLLLNDLKAKCKIESLDVLQGDRPVAEIYEEALFASISPINTKVKNLHRARFQKKQIEGLAYHRASKFPNFEPLCDLITFWENLEKAAKEKDIQKRIPLLQACSCDIHSIAKFNKAIPVLKQLCTQIIADDRAYYRLLTEKTYKIELQRVAKFLAVDYKPDIRNDQGEGDSCIKDTYFGKIKYADERIQFIDRIDERMGQDQTLAEYRQVLQNFSQQVSQAHTEALGIDEFDGSRFDGLEAKLLELSGKLSEFFPQLKWNVAQN